MNMTEHSPHNPEIPQAPPPIRWWKRLLRLAVALLIVGAGVAGGAYLKNTAPKTKKRPPNRYIPVVQIEPLRSTRHQVVIKATGTVIPARQVVLEARVSGQIVRVHPEFSEGGLLRRGDVVLELEDADHRLALAQKQSDLIDRQYALKLEMGRQTVAQREWRLLNGNLSGSASEAELALRKPHLEKAEADVAAAEAALEKAALDLARTRIAAPFNAMVRSKSVDLGSQVYPQESLGELVGTDRYWVRVAIPLERLEWIRIPQRAGDAGSSAAVHYARGHVVEGRVLRLLGDLSAEGRMARILIEVEDPLGRRKRRADHPPLLIGEYVRAAIQGRQLTDVFVIPRVALRDNGRVWLLQKDMTLAIRDVAALWRDDDTVIVKNDLKEGDRLIVSDLPAPLAGMRLRLEAAPNGSGGRQEPSKHGKGLSADEG